MVWPRNDRSIANWFRAADMPNPMIETAASAAADPLRQGSGDGTNRDSRNSRFGEFISRFGRKNSRFAGHGNSSASH
jgi:hypothetical protein